jgi:hypothetical protein
MAFAAILGGAGLGLGLTSLYAENAGNRRSQADDASMRFEILRRNIVVERGRIAETLEDGQVVRHAIIVGMKGRDVTREATARRFRMRTRVGPNGFDRTQLDRLLAQAEELRRIEQEFKGQDGERLERLRAQVEELELEAREMADFEALFEAFEGVESLEDLDLTIEMRQDEEDQRRRRRRRPPRRAADVPDSDGSGN